MKLLIDDAHMEVIRRLYEFYPIDGVTTNPSILAKSGRPPYEALKEIRAFIGKDADLHVQVLAMDAEGMVKDAHRIVAELGDATLVKIPCIPEGFKAMVPAIMILTFAWSLKAMTDSLGRQFIRRCRRIWRQKAERSIRRPISTGSIIWDLTGFR